MEMNFFGIRSQSDMVTKSLNNSKRKITKGSSNSGRKSATKANKTAFMDKMKPKITSKDQKMHRFIFMEGGLPENTEVYYISGGKILLRGRKQGRGIYCYCCFTEISASQFEAHAGMASRKKPYGNIFVSNGVSLHEYASNLKLTSEHFPQENDKLCSDCEQGGDLLPCDGCSRSFHRGCIPETIIDMRKWLCKYCWNTMKCVEHEAIEQIASPSIRIVDNPNKCDLIACVLCRAYDFTENGFDNRTAIVCDQCEREYHIGCLRERNIADLMELPHGNWFCHKDCEAVNSVLERMVRWGPEKVPGYTVEDKFDVEWMFIRGKYVSNEYESLLTEVVAIFQDRFNPVIDSLTGKDYITTMAHGLSMGATDFSGVHCAILMIDSKVVTAGMFRAFGKEILELAFAATSRAHEGKGYFQLFYYFMERIARHLQIKKIMIPATQEAKRMWIDKFGFEKITPQQLCELRQTHTSMVAFQNTTLLEKAVLVNL